MIAHSQKMKTRAAFLSAEEALREPWPPSERDVEIYETVVIAGETTRIAAATFQLSQTRIVQICERVAEWVATTLPETPRLTPEQRLRLASHVAERRLDHLYSLALQAFDKSMGEQTTVRSFGEGETAITRTSHGDIKYISLASRLTERKYAVVLRGLQGEQGLEREGEAPAEPSGGPASGVRQHPDDAAMVEVANRREAPASRSPRSVPPVGDCSRFDAVRPAGNQVARTESSPTADESAVYSEIEARRRAFLAALDNDTSPVQPPRVDAGGMLIEEPEEGEELALASVLPMASLTPALSQGEREWAGSGDPRPTRTPEEHGRRDACPTEDSGRTSPALQRPLSRRERRARQRMLEKKQKLQKAK